MLWDIVDGPSTPDATPGVDDAHDLLDLQDGEVWEVLTEPIREDLLHSVRQSKEDVAGEAGSGGGGGLEDLG